MIQYDCHGGSGSGCRINKQTQTYYCIEIVLAAEIVQARLIENNKNHNKKHNNNHLAIY